MREISNLMDRNKIVHPIFGVHLNHVAKDLDRIGELHFWHAFTDQLKLSRMMVFMFSSLNSSNLICGWMNHRLLIVSRKPKN